MRKGKRDKGGVYAQAAPIQLHHFPAALVSRCRLSHRLFFGPGLRVRSVALHGRSASRRRSRSGSRCKIIQQVRLGPHFTQCHDTPDRNVTHRGMGLRSLDGRFHPGRGSGRAPESKGLGPARCPAPGAGGEAFSLPLSGTERRPPGLDAGRPLCYDANSFFECAGRGPGAFRTHPFSNVGGVLQILTRTVHA